MMTDPETLQRTHRGHTELCNVPLPEHDTSPAGHPVALQPPWSQEDSALDAETNEVLEHIEDADGVLWPVRKLYGEHASCAVPWEVAVDTNGQLVIVTYIAKVGMRYRNQAGRRSGYIIPAPANGSTPPLMPPKL